jgi:hypothetical protein
MRFAGEAKSNLEYDQFGGLTKRTYRKHLNKITAPTSDKILFYSHTIDEPHNTPYTAIGKLVGNIDTVKIKADGFVNRTTNSERYLHKIFTDRTQKIISSEFIVPTDSGYFYLFSYAPIRHLLNNEEDVIIAQDSLRRKYTAVIGSLRK